MHARSLFPNVTTLHSFSKHNFLIKPDPQNICVTLSLAFQPAAIDRVSIGVWSEWRHGVVAKERKARDGGVHVRWSLGTFMQSPCTPTVSYSSSVTHGCIMRKQKTEFVRLAQTLILTRALWTACQVRGSAFASRRRSAQKPNPCQCGTHTHPWWALQHWFGKNRLRSDFFWLRAGKCRDEHICTATQKNQGLRSP